VFFAVFMIAILALLALVLGLGVISVSVVQMQQLSNLAALSALQGYFASPSTATPAARAAAALVRANDVMETNRVLGAPDTLTEGARAFGLPWTSGAVGTLTLGAWYSQDPDGTGGANPCSTGYPCFIAWEIEASPPSLINAARVEAKNDATNPIIAPFANIFGSATQQVKSIATAALVQRCTAYLLDLSISTTAMSHPVPNTFPSVVPGSSLGGNELRLRWALQPSEENTRLFAFREQVMFRSDPFSLLDPPVPPDSTAYSSACDQPLTQRDYWLELGNSFPSNNSEGHIWCNTLFSPATPDAVPYRPACTSVGTCAAVPGTFAQDYRRMNSQLGPVWVDTVTDPRPLRDFLLAFNSGLRLVREQSTSGDGAAVLPFDGAIRGRYPLSGVTSNFDILVQLTNADARGRLSSVQALGGGDWRVTQATGWDGEVHPNLIDLGWFPLYNAGGTFAQTHLSSALDNAISVIQASCPSTAKKDIVIATDGLATCSLRGGCPLALDFDRFDEAQEEILADASQTSVPENFRLLDRLQRNRIAVTTLLAGASVAPNFLNIRRLVGSPPQNVWVELSEAGSLGYGANFFNSNPSVPNFSALGCASADNECAYENVGATGVSFRAPNSVFGQLAFRTGGIFCPLMPICGNVALADCPNCDTAGFSDCYDASKTPPRLRDCARTEGQPQTCSVTNEDIGAQAARCVLESVGANPYILVEQ
jgi:hypothetical protein